MLDKERTMLEQNLNALEMLCQRDKPFVLWDQSRDPEGFVDSQALARSLPNRGVGVGILKLPAELLPQMSAFLPVAEVQKAFAEGRPIVCHPVRRAEMAGHPSRRPVDTPLIADSKAALERQAFLLDAAQTAVELSRGTVNNPVTRQKAADLSQTKIAKAVWQGGVDRDGLKKLSRLRGLIDRGRRKISSFFNALRAGDVAKGRAEHVAQRLADGRKAAEIEADHLDRASIYARNEARAFAHETAMYRWNRIVEKGSPIEPADLADLVNASPDRQRASDLMRIAIADDLNPADSHRNLETMRDSFDLGRRIGRFMRGEEIELSKPDAVLLAHALDTARRSAFENWVIETEADACNLYLADAVLAANSDSGWWIAIIDRILTGGVSEGISPAQSPI